MNLIGRIGYLQIHDSTSGFTLDNGGAVGDEQSDIGQGRLELKVEYPMGRFAPFIEGKLEHEFMSPGNPIRNNVVATNDTTGGEVGFGLITSFARNLSALVKFNSVVFREDYNEHSFVGELRLTF